MSVRNPRPARPTPAATAVPRIAWSAPEVTCLEARPEITAYSGDVGPWAQSR
jgi:hypothetical protein